MTKAGLSAGEAARRLSAEGPNLLPGSAPKSAFAIVRDVVTEPMFLMLLAAGGIYLALGERAPAMGQEGGEKWSAAADLLTDAPQVRQAARVLAFTCRGSRRTAL